MAPSLPRRVRAHFSQETVRVYQALPRATAAAALEAGTLIEPFRIGQMIWIKTSFLWVLERCRLGGGSNECILAIDVRRSAFDWLLAHSCDATFDPLRHPSRDMWACRHGATPVRLQWDNERDVKRQPLAWVSPRIGLSGDVLQHYTDDWIVGLHACEGLAQWIVRDIAGARTMPVEVDYPLPALLAATLGISAQHAMAVA